MEIHSGHTGRDGNGLKVFASIEQREAAHLFESVRERDAADGRICSKNRSCRVADLRDVPAAQRCGHDHVSLAAIVSKDADIAVCGDLVGVVALNEVAVHGGFLVRQLQIDCIQRLIAVESFRRCFHKGCLGAGAVPELIHLRVQCGEAAVLCGAVRSVHGQVTALVTHFTCPCHAQEFLCMYLQRGSRHQSMIEAIQADLSIIDENIAIDRDGIKPDSLFEIVQLDRYTGVDLCVALANNALVAIRIDSMEDIMACYDLVHAADAIVPGTCHPALNGLVRGQLCLFAVAVALEQGLIDWFRRGAQRHRAADLEDVIFAVIGDGTAPYNIRCNVPLVFTVHLCACDPDMVPVQIQVFIDHFKISTVGECSRSPRTFFVLAILGSTVPLPIHHTELAVALEGRALHLQLHGASVAYREIAAFCPDRTGFFFIFDDDLASVNVDLSVCDDARRRIVPLCHSDPAAVPECQIVGRDRTPDQTDVSVIK